ncbi:hypothetical protein BO71DRAFT_427043, partial [Aspergillus ellipticus CBS 707.79]
SKKLGLSVVPFLPYIFDAPVEEALEWTFRTGLRAYAGEEAVRPLPRVAHDSPSSAAHFAHTEQSAAGGADAATISWEEYKEQRRLAKENRRLERGGSGGGVLGLLGWGDKEKKE